MHPTLRNCRPRKVKSDWQPVTEQTCLTLPVIYIWFGYGLGNLVGLFKESDSC